MSLSWLLDRGFLTFAAGLYGVCALCVLTKLFVTFLFSLCVWTLYFLMMTIHYIIYVLLDLTKLIAISLFSVCSWALHILTVCLSYIILMFEYVGRLTWHFLEKLLHTHVAVGAVVTLTLVYGLVRGSMYLVAQVQSYRDQQHSSSEWLKVELERMKLQRLCVVCRDGQKQVAFKPCWHFCACSVCASKLYTCPVCRVPVQGSERIYDA